MPQALAAPRVRITTDHRRAYLEALVMTGSHSAACKTIGVSRRSVAAHIEAHDEFAEEVAEAKAAFADKLLATARMLGVEGVEIPIFHAGQVVGSRREISERILLKLLEKIGPDEFRASDKIVHEHTHSGEVRHVIAPAILAAMNPAARIEAQRVMLLEDMRNAPDAETVALNAPADLEAFARSLS